MPSGLGTIALFEAINNAKELEQMANWVRAELDRHLVVLTDPARGAPDKGAYLAGATRMRAYFNPNRSYAKRHRALSRTIDDWFVANTARLGSHAADLRKLHQVVEQDVSHERQVRTGLQGALGVAAGGGAPVKAGTTSGQGSISPTGPPPPVDAPQGPYRTAGDDHRRRCGRECEGADMGAAHVPARRRHGNPADAGRGRDPRL